MVKCDRHKKRARQVVLQNPVVIIDNCMVHESRSNGVPPAELVPNPSSDGQYIGWVRQGHGPVDPIAQPRRVPLAARIQFIVGDDLREGLLPNLPQGRFG